MKLNMLGFLGFLGLLGSLGSTENAALYGLLPNPLEVVGVPGLYRSTDRGQNWV
jgi:hypothetical protein